MQAPDSAQDLTDLCQRCGAGDEEAFSQVYGLFSRQLYGTALRMLGRSDEAEDAVQDTFLTFYKQSAGLEVSNLGGWLHRVTVNRCLDQIRRRKRRGEVELFDDRARPPRGQTLDIQKALGKLPDRARTVFVLHDVEGFKHREVAEMLQISEGTSKSQLFRAREVLRQELSPREASS
jgi:RNA polymerase sigma-70 factor (ECF subfamily)